MFESIINKLSIQYIVFFNPFSPRPIPLLFYLSDNFNRQGRASRWERVIKVLHCSIGGLLILSHQEGQLLE